MSFESNSQYWFTYAHIFGQLYIAAFKSNCEQLNTITEPPAIIQECSNPNAHFSEDGSAPGIRPITICSFVTRPIPGIDCYEHLPVLCNGVRLSFSLLVCTHEEALNLFCMLVMHYLQTSIHLLLHLKCILMCDI